MAARVLLPNAGLGRTDDDRLRAGLEWAYEYSWTSAHGFDLLSRGRVLLVSVFEADCTDVRSPLALRIAAARTAAPPNTLADVVAELADDRNPLDALSRGGDEAPGVTAVRALVTNLDEATPVRVVCAEQQAERAGETALPRCGQGDMSERAEWHPAATSELVNEGHPVPRDMTPCVVCEPWSMNLNRRHVRGPRLAAGTPTRVVRTQALRRPALAPKHDQTGSSPRRRWLARVGSWNWAAIASVIAALAAASGVFYTGRSLDATRVQNDTAEQSQLTDRFTKAVDQLDRSGPEHLQARLGAIYALERLAHDSPRDHSTVVEVLAAFIRTTTPPPKFGSAGASLVATSCPTPVIAADIQAALTVLGRRDSTHDDPTRPINLEATCLVRADLKQADLTGVDLAGACLISANFFHSNISNATFNNAILRDANFTFATAEQPSTSHPLRGAEFDGADLANATLESSQLSGSSFNAASFKEC